MADRLTGRLMNLVTRAHNPRRIAVSMANNPEVIGCIGRAMHLGLAEFVLIGPTARIEETAEAAGVDVSGAEIVEKTDGVSASREAAALAASGSVQVIMKGLVQTSDFVRAILDRSFGLLESDGLLNHVAMVDVAAYHKPFFLTDAAIVVSPSVEEKIRLVKNAVAIARALGIAEPKVACVAPVEKVSEKLPSTIHAARIVEHFATEASGTSAIVDGPFGLDVALSCEAADIKGIHSDVAGDADIILVSDIDAGNALYKSISLLAGGAVAGVVAGARVPVVLTSRADSEATKFTSVLLALASSATL